MLIYIMGRGYSGSTILDIILGNSAAVESVGELVSGLKLEPEGHACACGRPMQCCDYWQTAHRVLETHAQLPWAETAGELVAHAHIRNLPHTLLASPGAPRMQQLARASTAFAAAIGAVTGKSHVLDSSKEPTRALMLLRFCPEARVIHLVRDPRRNLASYYWRFKKDGGYFHFLRRKYRAPHMLVPFMLLAGLSWTAGNLICEIARRFAPERAMRVRYEDLCVNPRETLGRIAEVVGLSLDDVILRIERGEPLMIGHNIGGNQIRTKGQVVFAPEKGREHPLPRWLEGVILVSCWPLMLAYGYSLRPLERLAEPARAC